MCWWSRTVRWGLRHLPAHSLGRERFPFSLSELISCKDLHDPDIEFTQPSQATRSDMHLRWNSADPDFISCCEDSVWKNLVLHSAQGCLKKASVRAPRPLAANARRATAGFWIQDSKLPDQRYAWHGRSSSRHSPLCLCNRRRHYAYTDPACACKEKRPPGHYQDPYRSQTRA